MQGLASSQVCAKLVYPRGMSERLLTVRQPWASCFFSTDPSLAKTVENRRWVMNYRGRLWIHAAQEVDFPARRESHVREALDPEGASVEDAREVDLRALPKGVVLGSVMVDDCHEHMLCCWPWGEQRPGVFHICVSDPRPLPDPIPATGKLGTWTADPSLERILTAMDRV
jgi:hypothetical protein